ncbi:voltage-dependent calcium channel subunit alpha-2/delta-3 isoform X6 [Cryptotermes secundus]|uniref:voltage-dependent calcium channel subunit alpha-2/delta-3 isoform X6 n=1 Tax=Cryptotermes secundus TaxID=105785 RepID=UPI000CD7C323|nr:voltage-dependent calcium channel subunit alpha-2/delta-3 isoform X6 [Cryptotermes secundus]
MCCDLVCVCVSNMGNARRRRMSWTMFSLNSKIVQCYSCLLLFSVVLMAFLPTSLEQDEDIPHNEVKNWALKFGVDLWEFGRQFTKMSEIQKKYHDLDVEVIRKDGLILIREMAAEVKNMMDIKMNAVMRIMDSAEQAALSHKLDAGTAVRYYNARRLNEFGPDGRLQDGSKEMSLTQNRHFDQLAVNTSLSSVLLPPEVRDSDPEVLNAIKWSEHLDPLFVNNYEMDPSLSWQYFGSTTGFLRRYPAIKWPPDYSSARSGQELHDFRTSSWYIDSATSPKDVVVLLDSSGSMSGERREIATSVVNAILDTLGDNDFVNVYRFSDATEELVPCFKDMLVQANMGNIRELRSYLDSARAENIANFSSALITAFEILHKYNRTGKGCQCNQAIMLITDGPPYDYYEIFKQYNLPHTPIRVFTYLIGRDSSNAEEMNKIACTNKGYYVRVSSTSEAREKVLNYISVMARPMVMYQNDHPIQWTPVYAGGKGNYLQSNGGGNLDGQLMTSVSTPVFDRRNYSVRVANLLGVVGTDVPIQQIQKLVQPYKLGVNGYSFIINNNGHILYHPDLRPLFQETLKPNYNSVDLTEVELVDMEGGPRENNTFLLDLRHDMIDQKEGETELSVKVHYDDMKRVTTRRHKYFYNAIEGTPFSLGLAIPEGYGMYEVLGEQEIKHSHINVTEYFKGSNWKIHPDWVYCEYNSMSEHHFKTPEEQVLWFLSKAGKPGWKWMSLRPRSPLKDGPHNMKKTEKDSYFCDKSLVQSLVFDALVTEGLDRHVPSTLKEDENPLAMLMALLHRQGYQMFGVTLSFIATRSGLLRWQDHAHRTMGESGQPTSHFSELNRRAIDEVWYKRAVDQHSLEPESFVFSVPFDAASSSKPLVTATHAVFIEHKGHRAPAAVVGLQIQHSSLASHFLNITSTCMGCKKTCASEELDCYVLDNNGFIILSESADHTGKFFGQIDGTIMDSLVQDRIYKKVAVYDYQGACLDQKSPYSDDATRPSALQPFRWLLQWAFSRVVWLAMQINLFPNWVLSDDDGTVYSEDYETNNFDQYSTRDETRVLNGGSPSETQIKQQLPPSTPTSPLANNRTMPRPCDKRVDLYVLQPDRLNTSGQFNPLKGKLTNCHITGCERPFSVQKIPRSNLILLVVDTLCPCGSKQLSITPQEVIYESMQGVAVTTQCRIKPQEVMYRRRPPKCMNYHPEESEIKLCGNCGRAYLSASVLVFCLLVWIISGTLVRHWS